MEGKGEEEDEGHGMLRKREQLLVCVHCARGSPSHVPVERLDPPPSEAKDSPHIRGQSR